MGQSRTMVATPGLADWLDEPLSIRKLTKHFCRELACNSHIPVRPATIYTLGIG